jgi:hypothetical protein
LRKRRRRFGETDRGGGEADGAGELVEDNKNKMKWEYEEV